MSDEYTLEALQDRLLEINEKENDIVNRATAEERDLTDDEVAMLDELKGDFAHTEKRINSIKSVIERGEKLRQSFGRKTEPDNMDDMQAKPDDVQRRPAGSIIMQPWATKGNWGFRNVGEYALAVHAAKSKVDPRLIKNAPTTYGTEGVAADGGFAVPPDFRTEIWEKVAGEESLLSRTDQMNISGNTVTIPKDETTSWDSSGGIQAYWEGEASALTESKPLLENVTLRTNKLTALIPVSEELMEDAPSLDGYLRRKTAQKFDYKLQYGFVKGDGASMPLGIKNANCLTSVAKESGQAADTVVYANIVNMWSRMYAPCRARAVWHINQDVEPQLLNMGFAGGTYAPAYMPANGLSGSPYSTLMGRPILPLQSCEKLGDKGDIYLVDWSQYLTVVKGGLKDDVSMHLYFNYDMLAFRFIMRLTGQPWWRTYVTPASGSSNYLSCAVTLDERS